MIISKTMKLQVLAIVLIVNAMPGTLLFARGPAAFAKVGFSQDAAQLFGNWTGESLCQVKNSPCHDEKVVYHISKSKDPGKVTITADKIVQDKAITMGTEDFLYDEKTRTLVNKTEHGVWKFTVKEDQMSGTLTLPDGTIYRRVSLKKGADK